MGFADKSELIELMQYIGSNLPAGYIPASKFDRNNMFSTSEKIVGQWIDGKPIYQKTVEVATTSQSAKTDKVYNLTTDATFELRNGNGIIIHDSGKVEYTPVAYIANSDGVVRRAYYIEQDSGTKYINFLVKAFSAITNTATVYVTLLYTKTTDSPIAIGDFNDFTTTERMVGTWIDGKPLYQKTFTGTTSSSAGTEVVIANLDEEIEVRNIDGMVNCMVPVNYYGTSNYYTRCYTINNELRIAAAGYLNMEVYITLLYTKTTD